MFTCHLIVRLLVVPPLLFINNQRQQQSFYATGLRILLEFVQPFHRLYVFLLFSDAISYTTMWMFQVGSTERSASDIFRRRRLRSLERWRHGTAARTPTRRRRLGLPELHLALPWIHHRRALPTVRPLAQRPCFSTLRSIHFLRCGRLLLVRNNKRDSKFAFRSQMKDIVKLRWCVRSPRWRSVG